MFDMDRKKKNHDLLSKIADQVFEYIKKKGELYSGGSVPSVRIKKALGLNFFCVPKNNKQYGEKGWLIAILARML